MILTPPGSSPPPTLFRSPSVSAALTLLNEFIETRDRILRATEVAPLADDQLLHIPNIAASDFDTLRKLFEQDQTFRYGRLRLNYSSASRELIVYMPSTAHEFFVTEMSEMLGSALKNVLSDSHSTRSTRKAMKRMGLSFYRSSELLLAKGYIEPDEQIGSREEEEQLPMLVLEVAVSQSWDALRRKLVRIVVETEGEVKFALGFKLEAGRGVRVVAYQPEETEVEREGSDSDGSSDSGSGSDAGTVVFGERCVLDDVVVRPDGSVRQGELRIPFAVFFGNRLPECVNTSKDCIAIPYKKIAKMAAKARKKRRLKGSQAAQFVTVTNETDPTKRRKRKIVWRAKHDG